MSPAKTGASLRPVAAVLELGGGRMAGAMPIADLLNPAMVEADRRRVAYYLLRAETVIYTLSEENDVLDGETTNLSASWKADDRWFWREDLAHYVLRYGCHVPDEFIDWCAVQGWRPPVLEEAQLIEIGRAVGDAVFGR